MTAPSSRSIAIDLKQAEGLEVIHTILARTDVLVENFRPGVLERLGLGYADLQERYPHLIYASGSGFGLTGPLAGRGGQDLLAQAMSGMAFHARGADERPQLHPVALADYCAGMALAQGVLLALVQRGKTGRGQHVTVSLLDSMLFSQLQELAMWSARRFEVNWETQNLAGVFRCNDGWICIVGLFRENPLREVCLALGLPDLSADERFTTNDLQVQNRSELWPLLDAGFEKHSVQRCLQSLDERDILCAEVLDYDDVIDHPQVRANQSLVELDVPGLGPVSLVKSPVRLSANPDLPMSLPQTLGQDTTAILEELGWQADEIDRLRRSAVVS
jgi:formyl-CoA transferase